MKRTKILSLIALVFCFTLNLRAQSGTCGTNLTWELVNDTLIITGSGAMNNSRPWSSYLSQIVHVSLPDGLTNICDDAFDSASKLQSIVIPNTVTSIGKDAFYSCTSLKQITMSNAVETIGSYAFYKTAITSITLPSTLISLGEYAFYYCKQLTEITIPGNLSFIAKNTFYECTNLRKLNIEEGVNSIGANAFEGCSKLTSVSIAEGLISISSYAFYGCGAMTEISLPSSLISIGERAFTGCSSLSKIILPNSLQTIGTFAFSGSGLTHIDIPNSVTDIQEYAFRECKNLTSVILSSNLKSIKTGVFAICPVLSSVTIPEGVTVIHGGAFYGCNLTEITLPNSLEGIGNAANPDWGAFGHNTNLTSIVIPEKVTRIGSFAFDDCTSLSQVTLQEGLTTIAKCAFMKCNKLQEVTLPESLTTIESNAFSRCNLRELTIPHSLQTIADGTTYNDNAAGVFSHNTNLTKVVFQGEDTQIGSYAFYGCSALSQVTLPKGITTISAATFMGCSSLSSIALPESLAVIEGGAFFGCDLESIVFPQSLQIIADAVDKAGVPTYDYHGAFENNYKLTKITIPDKVTSIGSWAFEQCTSLSEVILPEGLTTIGDKAFNYCSSLKTIQLPKTVSSISTAFAYSGLVEIEIPENVTILSGAFQGCSQLKNVILPPTITSIGNNTFKDCKSLPTIALPQSLTSIGNSAFEGCYVLDNIVLPSQVKTIGSTAFKNCRILREITIPDNVTAISSSLFLGCTSLTTINLPSYLTSVGSCAFQDCNSLKEILLPEGITNIGYYAFENCYALHSLTIPSTVVTLEHYMFSGCKGLSTLNMLPLAPPSLDRTFSEAPSNLIINLLCGAKEAYMANANWAKLSYPINEISSNILTVKSNDNRMGEAYIPTPNTCDNDTAIIEALPREGYQFAHWHDGNTDNPRTITVDSDTTFTAIFEPLTTYQLTVNYDSKQGHVAGVGEYYPNEEATLTVTPLGGYRFKQWGDGNTDNPRTIIMTQDTVLEALFIMGDYCGDDILYTFLNDTLALNGTGDMWNLSEFGWKMYADEVMAVTLSNGITSLGTNAFMDLMFLPEVTIPASVKTIHKRAFENCRSLYSVTFAPNSQLQTIDHWAFYECINLRTLDIPEGVTTIGNGAFYGCAYLDSIVLPASMQSIADNGFAHCAKLSAMTVNAVTPPAVDAKTFENVNRAIPVYVPYGSGAIYRATPIWQEFNIQEMEATPCDEAVELNWQYDIRLSQLIAGWYKLYVGDIHANQTDFTYTIINDLACDVILSSAIHIDCADEESLVEGSKWVTMGIHTKTITYAEFAGMIPVYVDYLYLNIESIFEDCTPPCEDITTEEYATICHGETYTWNGQTYSTEGEYSIVLMNALGCDSIATLHLTVLPEAAVYSTTVTICEGETYIWRGMELSQGGSYTDVEQDPTTGCDIAIYTLLLTIEDCAPPCEDITTEEYATICYGETYTWNGQSYPTTGEYTQTLSSVAGCDSIVTLYLTVLPETIIVKENVTINEEYLPYTWRNQQCYSAGTYNENIPFVNYPYCDSVIYVLNLIVEAPNKCGDHLYWHYSNNTMTITGSGAMYDDPDLLSYRQQPWYPERVSHVILPNAITHIGNVAFADCANLTHIDIPNSVTSLGDGAFSWTGLQYVTIPIGVTTIGEQVFETCNDLRTILYEGNPTTINNKTVHPLIGCVHLDTIITPAALWHCTTADPALETRYGVPNKAHYIEITNGELTKQAMTYIAKNRGTMQVLDLSAATNTTLPLGALMNSYRLSNLYLPEQIRTIPEMLAEGCHNLTEIIIPATVKEIGNYAFAGCTNVWQMTVDAVVPPTVYAETFKDIDRNISVIVPAGSEEAYRQAAYWQEFFIKDTNSPSPITNCQKILHEDQILILRNGNIYTTMGQLVEKK